MKSQSSLDVAHTTQTTSTAASQSLAAVQKRGASSILQYDHSSQAWPHYTCWNLFARAKYNLFLVAQPEYTVVEYATQRTTMIVFAFKVEQKTLAKLY